MFVSFKSRYKKIALILSVCLIIIWVLLGTGASLAWFTDTSPEVKNIINIADFDLEVSYRLEDGVTYMPIEGETDIFNDSALYEPGHTQTVFLKVKNNSSMAFDYRTAVIILDYTAGKNVFGRSFVLQEYLKFGLVTADTEDELETMVSAREKARAFATEPLNNYYTEASLLDAGQTEYMALVVYMPEDVDNNANYRGIPKPEVELGISVTATQQ